VEKRDNSFVDHNERVSRNWRSSKPAEGATLAQIAVHDYLQQIDQLINDNRLAEAVAHCRYILEHHPRFVAAYRLLGKALLEQQKFADAADVFQRVLSTEPEDFIAHVALSIIQKEAKELPQATWHMERAFEMDPYSEPIQEELKDLYGRRDGLRPEQLFLTSAALARLYYRGGLYQQAAIELRRILANGDNRPDLQSLLAESLWQDDQRVDAVEVGLDLLARLPDCISANAVLAEVWLITGRIDEAQHHLQRLQELTLVDNGHCDPDTAVGRAFKTHGAIPLPDYIQIEELEYAPGFTDDENAADWVRELGLALEEEGEESVEAGGWLEAMDAVQDEPEAPTLPEALVAFDLSPESEESGAEFDWLRQVAAGNDMLPSVTDESEAGVDSPTAADGESTDWFLTPGQADQPDEDSTWPAADEVAESATADGEFPDWLNAGGETADSATLEGEFPDWLNAGGEVAGSAASEEDLPDWLNAGGEMADSATLEGEFPDWLNAGGEVAGSAASEEDLPDWLSAGVDELDTGPNVDEEFAAWESEPDEFLGTAVTGESQSSLIESRTDVSDEEIPDWLLNGHDPLEDEIMGASDQSEKPEQPVPDEFDEAMAWFDQLEAGQGASMDELPTVTPEPGSAGEPDEEDESDLPPWLKMELESAPAVDDEGIPAWLQSDEATDAETGQADWIRLEEAEAGDSEEPAVSPGEIPDWLKEQIPDGVNDVAGDNDSGEDLTWLDQIAAGEGAAIEEPPTLSWEEVEESAAADNLAWIDELAVAGSADAWQDDEMHEAPGESGDWLEELEPQQEDSEAELPAVTEDAAAEDAVPDWLQEEVAEDSTSSSELEWPDEWERDSHALFAEADLAGDSEIPADGALMATLLSPNLPEAESSVPFTAAAGDEITVAEDGVEEITVAGSRDETPEVGALDAGVEEPHVSALAEEELAAEIPDDPDEAMAWLERLAAQQGAPLDELLTLTSEAELDWDAAEVVVDEAEAEVQALAPESALLSQPEVENVSEDEELEPDETMAWLERLASGEDEVLEELSNILAEDKEAAVTEVQAAAPEPVLEEQAPDPSFIGTEALAPAAVETDEIPETPLPDDSLELGDDDGLAWLEQLAARQGASLDELTSVATVSQDVAMPDWLTAEMAAAEETETEGSIEEETTAGVQSGEQEVEFSEALAALEDVAPDSMVELAAELGAEVEDALVVAAQEAQGAPEEEAGPAAEKPGAADDDIVESLPDWLSFAPSEKPGNQEVDWLDDLIATDIDSWLTAEEEITLHDPIMSTGPLPPLDVHGLPQARPQARPEPERAAEVETPPPPQPEAEPDRVAATTVAQVADLEEPAADLEPAAGAERMAAARQALIARDYQQALAEYTTLLNSDINLRLLIADLETAATNHSRQPLLRRLLGDAYMRNGQLQKALDTYRRALEQL
jgi:tetratricopeptide (TPR) repeat protein